MFSRCHVIEMRSLNVILDKPNDAMIDKNMFIQKYFQMLPLKMDPSFGLYKVKLFKKKHEEVMDVCDLFNSTEIDSSITNNLYSIPSKSPELFSITEINVRIDLKNISSCLFYYQFSIVLTILVSY